MYGGVRNLKSAESFVRPVAKAPKRDWPPSSPSRVVRTASTNSSGSHTTREPDFTEHAHQAVPVAGNHVLNALGEALHDARLHRAHQSKVQEGQAPVFTEHQIALMWICVHISGVQKLGHTCLDRSLNQQQLALLWQI
eukprot:scaffold1437_cov353-Prasinococcus_capsulatus_cf.AAC.10